VRPDVFVAPLAAQHFLNFVPLPHGQGSFRPTAIFHSSNRAQGSATGVSRHKSRISGREVVNRDLPNCLAGPALAEAHLC